MNRAHPIFFPTVYKLPAIVFVVFRKWLGKTGCLPLYFSHMEFYNPDLWLCSTFWPCLSASKYNEVTFHSKTRPKILFIVMNCPHMVK